MQTYEILQLDEATIVVPVVVQVESRICKKELIVVESDVLAECAGESLPAALRPLAVVAVYFPLIAA